MRTNDISTTALLIAALAAMVGCQKDRPATNTGASAAQQVAVSPLATLIARAKSLELDTPYAPPPGDPLEHHTAGFAKIMCSRLGHFKGSTVGSTGFRKALALLMNAFPQEKK